MTGAYRTFAQQEELFHARYSLENAGLEPRMYQGKTYWLKKGEAMVASPGTSNHGWGCAIDMALGDCPRLAVAVTKPFVEGLPASPSRTDFPRRLPAPAHSRD